MVIVAFSDVISTLRTCLSSVFLRMNIFKSETGLQSDL